ncbi:MAG: MltA domain-containing protein [Planctomycetota bacterium]|nr:MltA domain-containing protein [Planctomycetota bacterium]
MMKQTITIIPLLFTIVGCTGQQTTTLQESSDTDYTRVLQEGEQALTRIPVENWPDIGSAWDARDLFLEDAIDNSIAWFSSPSSKQWFPISGITHQQAENSVRELRTILSKSDSKHAFMKQLQTRFDIYKSIGCDGDGTVLFTGYYSPDFHASTSPNEQYSSPLYQRPDDLVTDPNTGEPLGRMNDDGLVTTWPTRTEIESSGLLDGTELVWLENDFDAYIIHVNGSARLRMDNGELMYVGYAGKTDRPYSGLGQSLMDAGMFSSDDINLRAIKRMYNKNPNKIKKHIDKNESYVFFTEYSGNNWPAGSLGVPVTQERSIATDKKIFPRGGVVLVDTTVKSLTGEEHVFVQFMTDQDTGGAINAPGRADLFMGIGPTAGIRAGNQYAEGQLYYIFLKQELASALKD